jgi:PTS system nitrogen regulatory IIA component
LPHRSMSIREVATYLHLASADVEKLVRERDIPCEKQGDRFIFRRSIIDAWASQRILALSTPRLAEYHSKTSSKVGEFSPDSAVMPALITPERLNPALTSKTRSSVLRDLVAMAEKNDLVSDPKELRTMLEEREALCSTALPGGLAVLHPRHHDPYLVAESFMVLGRTIQPIHFGSQDGKPTDIFFLLCCQDDRLHLHTLARLCTMCLETPLLDELRAADSGREMQDIILRTEAEIIRRL